MYNTAIVAFREILEIAIILGVILAATRGIAGRSKWVVLGLVGGVLGSVLVAVFAAQISGLAKGMGQEIFNGSILLIAALMIGWTVVWMRTHARTMIAKLKALGSEVSHHTAPMYAISIAIALAALREGSEIVIFSYANLLSGISITNVIVGALLGTSAGAVVGYLIYRGLIKISTKYIFRVTTWLLILLAAGMASKAAGMFVAGGLIESLTSVAWDSSFILPQNSWLGKILEILIGYTETPMLIQLLFYAATLAAIVFFILIGTSHKKPR